MGAQVREHLELRSVFVFAVAVVGAGTRSTGAPVGQGASAGLPGTTLALIAGMIPVAIGIGEGADFRAPLGRAVIGGVITSTLLTLLVIPTVYEILDGLREWLAAKVLRRVIRPHPEPSPRPAATGE